VAKLEGAPEGVTMESQSVVKLLDGFWDAPWSELPIKQREAWYLCAYLNSAQRVAGPCERGTPEMSSQFEWGNLTPEQRLKLAVAHDWEYDPDGGQEYEFWFNNACEISDVEREIREIELMLAPLPSERHFKAQQLADAKRRLVDLKSAQFQPSTVESSSEAQDNKEQAALPVTVPSSTTIHRVETRKNILTAVISSAKKRADDKNDPHSHWAAFVNLAESENRPSPLLGYAEGEGVKYQSENGVEFLNKKNFIRRAKRRSTGKRQ